MCTYSLCGGLRCHAVFVDGQSESVFDARFQLGAGDSQYRPTGAQAEAQTGAVLCTLQAHGGLGGRNGAVILAVFCL